MRNCLKELNLFSTKNFAPNWWNLWNYDNVQQSSGVWRTILGNWPEHIENDDETLLLPALLVGWRQSGKMSADGKINYQRISGWKNEGRWRGTRPILVVAYSWRSKWQIEVLNLRHNTHDIGETVAREPLPVHRLLKINRGIWRKHTAML